MRRIQLFSKVRSLPDEVSDQEHLIVCSDIRGQSGYSDCLSQVINDLRELCLEESSPYPFVNLDSAPELISECLSGCTASDIDLYIIADEKQAREDLCLLPALLSSLEAGYARYYRDRAFDILEKAESSEISSKELIQKLELVLQGDHKFDYEIHVERAS